MLIADASGDQEAGWQSWVRGLLMLVALFLVFTPFESDDGSLAANYAVTVFCLAATLVLTPISSLKGLLWPSASLLLPAAVILHSLLLSTQGFSPYSLLLIVSFATAIVLVEYANSRPVEFLAVARVFLVISMTALLYQFISFQLGGEVVDLHAMLFPGTARIEIGTEAESVIRLTGFQTEPGNYSTWIMLLVLASRLIAGRFGIIESLATCSVLMTYSATGVFFVGIAILWMLADSLVRGGAKKWMWLVVFGALVLAAASAFDLLDHYEERFLGRDDASLMYRYWALQAYSYLTTSEKLLGFGFLDEICDCHFSDLGFGPNLVMRGGILVALGVLPWLWVAWRRRSAIAVLSIVSTVYFAKTPPFSIAAWFALLLLSDVRQFESSPSTQLEDVAGQAPDGEGAAT
ncbi:MAG: hypothetical protein QM766_05555 [Burkholderiaceae bacterium]